MYTIRTIPNHAETSRKHDESTPKKTLSSSRCSNAQTIPREIFVHQEARLCRGRLQRLSKDPVSTTTPSEERTSRHTIARVALLARNRTDWWEVKRSLNTLQYVRALTKEQSSTNETISNANTSMHVLMTATEHQRWVKMCKNEDNSRRRRASVLQNWYAKKVNSRLLASG